MPGRFYIRMSGQCERYIVVGHCPKWQADWQQETWFWDAYLACRHTKQSRNCCPVRAMYGRAWRPCPSSTVLCKPVCSNYRIPTCLNGASALNRLWGQGVFVSMCFPSGSLYTCTVLAVVEQLESKSKALAPVPLPRPKLRQPALESFQLQ